MRTGMAVHFYTSNSFVLKWYKDETYKIFLYVSNIYIYFNLIKAVIIFMRKIIYMGVVTPATILHLPTAHANYHIKMMF